MDQENKTTAPEEELMTEETAEAAAEPDADSTNKELEPEVQTHFHDEVFRVKVLNAEVEKNSSRPIRMKILNRTAR